MEREIANCKVDQCPVVVASPGSLLSAFSIIMPCRSYGMKLYRTYYCTLPSPSIDATTRVLSHFMPNVIYDRQNCRRLNEFLPFRPRRP